MNSSFFGWEKIVRSPVSPGAKPAKCYLLQLALLPKLHQACLAGLVTVHRHLALWNLKMPAREGGIFRLNDALFVGNQAKPEAHVSQCVLLRTVLKPERLPPLAQVLRKCFTNWWKLAKGPWLRQLLSSAMHLDMDALCDAMAYFARHPSLPAAWVRKACCWILDTT